MDWNSYQNLLLRQNQGSVLVLSYGAPMTFQLMNFGGRRVFVSLDSEMEGVVEDANTTYGEWS